MDEIDELLYDPRTDDYETALKKAGIIRNDEDEDNDRVDDIHITHEDAIVGVENLSMKVMRDFVKYLFEENKDEPGNNSKPPQFILCSATFTYRTQSAGARFKHALGAGLNTDMDKLFDPNFGIFSKKNIGEN